MQLCQRLHDGRVQDPKNQGGLNKMYFTKIQTQNRHKQIKTMTQLRLVGQEVLLTKHSLVTQIPTGVPL